MFRLNQIFVGLISSFTIITAQVASAEQLRSNSYAIQTGDFGDDGDSDILLKIQPLNLPLNIDDISFVIPILSPYPSYLLENQGDGTYLLVAAPPSVDLAQVAWSDSGYLQHSGDFNGDGLKDLLLQGSENGDSSFVLTASENDTLALAQQISNDNFVVTNASIAIIDSTQDGRDDLIINSAEIVIANNKGVFSGIEGGWRSTSSTFVGTTHGAGGVTTTGAAEYSFDISLPSESIPLKPNLSLKYNSRGGNGLLGVGWHLAGLSTIQHAAIKSKVVQRLPSFDSTNDRVF